MNEIYLFGEVGTDITLKDVVSQVNALKSKDEINVNIHSIGGSVYEGLAIYNYLKGLNVNTTSNGMVASIASVFFLAGKKRTINSLDNFLIHLPSATVSGNKDDFKKVTKELSEIENKIAGIYEKETNISKENAIKLMRKDEFLDINFLLENKFVTDVRDFKAVAKYDINFNNMDEQLTLEKAENLFDKFANKIKDILGKNATENKVIQDANGIEVDFFKLENSDKPQIGDEATIDGVKAKGEVLMPNGETYVFENGKLEKIKDKEFTEIEAKMKEATVTIENQVKLVETLTSERDELKNKLDEKEKSVKELEKEFTEFKNKITSNFKYEEKQEKEEIKADVKSRTNFKSKLK